HPLSPAAVDDLVSFFLQAEDGIRDDLVTGVQTCALPISTTTRNVTAGQVDTKTGLTANADAVIRDPFSSGGNLNIIPAAEFSNATSVLLPMIPDPSLPGNINNAFRLNGCCPILSRNAYTDKI